MFKITMNNKESYICNYNITKKMKLSDFVFLIYDYNSSVVNHNLKLIKDINHKQIFINTDLISSIEEVE